MSRIKLFVVAIAAAVVMMITPAHMASTLLVVASGGSGAGTCTVTPCTIARAVAVMANGDTIEVGAGTYATDITMNVQNVRFTTSATIRDAISWSCNSAWVVARSGDPDCGIALGTDNRPQFNGDLVVSATGVTVDNVKFRANAAPVDNNSAWVATITAENVTLEHNELYNGFGGVGLRAKRSVTITHNYLHDLGPPGGVDDNHGVEVQGQAGQTESVSFTTGHVISHNTIIDGGGDGIQENTNAYGSGTFSYLTASYNYLHTFDEQCGDMKGTRFLRWHGNDCSDNGEGGLVATDDPVVTNKTDWDVWDNFFHDMNLYAITWAQNDDGLRWHIWNNYFARTVQGPGFNTGSIQLPGDSGTYFVFNTLVDNDRVTGSFRGWGVYNCGGSGAGCGGGSAGNNVRNNAMYRNGKCATCRGHMSNISGEDAGTPVGNYVNDPTTIGVCGATCQIGNSTTTTCFGVNNCIGVINLAADDVRPTTGSPLIDATNAQDIGSHVSLTDSGNFTPSIDAAGTTRDTTTPDIGMFEFASTTRRIVPWIRRATGWGRLVEPAPTPTSRIPRTGR